jgi:hypothetical protein
MKSRWLRWPGHMHMAEVSSAYKIFARKLDGKKPLGGILA